MIGQLTELTQLSLNGNQLTGSIPPEIGQLTELTELWLGDNQLSGSIPPEIGQLTELTGLWLGWNQLSGSIPPEIGQLTELTGLNLNYNQLTGSIPPEIGQLTELTGLALARNQLSGSIPPEIGQLTELIGLGLDDNQLSGSIPPEIGQLTELTRLHLGENRLSGCIPDPLRFLDDNDHDLDELNLPYCGSGASVLDDRAVLMAFYESTNGDGWSTKTGWTDADTPLDQWYGVTTDSAGRVVDLDLAHNDLSGQIPESIGQLTELESLLLSDNSLTGSPPASMGALRELDTLWLFGSGLSGCLPGQLRDVLADGKTDVAFTPLSWCDQEHPKPMPETPASVTWHMGDSVPEPVRRAVRLGVKHLHEYAAQKGWPATGDEVEVYVDDTPRLIDTCRRRWPEHATRCGYLEGRGGLVIDRTAFVVDDVPDGNREINRVLGVAETAVHENIHMSFQISVAGYDRDVAPWWFIEGMATYFAAAVEQTYFPGRFNRHRDEWVRKAGSSTALLSAWENAESAPDAEADDGCWYECGALAIELLAYEFHVRSIGDFYTALNRNILARLMDIFSPQPAWRAAFEDTFGITADKFYEAFEKQRDAGFPELDPIR